MSPIVAVTNASNLHSSTFGQSATYSGRVETNGAICEMLSVSITSFAGPSSSDTPQSLGTRATTRTERAGGVQLGSPMVHINNAHRLQTLGNTAPDRAEEKNRGCDEEDGPAAVDQSISASQNGRARIDVPTIFDGEGSLDELETSPRSASKPAC